MLSTDGGGTHWFQAWHRTRPPVVPWPGTETGSGLCGSLWRTSACLSPQSHCLLAAQWTCHLKDRETTGKEGEAGRNQGKKQVGKAGKQKTKENMVTDEQEVSLQVSYRLSPWCPSPR